MIFQNYKNILISKGLAIDVSDDDFDLEINNLGFSNIFGHDYVLPFLNTSSQSKIPYVIFNDISSSFKSGVKFSEIIEFIKLDIWLGNIITEIYHYAEIYLISKIENLFEANNNINLLRNINFNLQGFNNRNLFNSFVDFITTITYNTKDKNSILLRMFDRLTFDGSIKIFQNLKSNYQNKIIDSYAFSQPLTPVMFIYINDAIRLARNDSSHYVPIFSSKFGSKILSSITTTQNLKLEEQNLLNNFKNIIGSSNNRNLSDYRDISIIEGLKIIGKLFKLENIVDPILQEIEHKFINYLRKLNDSSIRDYINNSLKTRW